MSADGRLGVLELLLDAADDSLAIGAHERAEDELRVNRMRTNDLAGDSHQVTNTVRRQVADFELGVDVGERDIILLQKKDLIQSATIFETQCQ